LGCIDSSGFDVPTPKTDKEKLEFLAAQFKAYNYRNNVKYWNGNYQAILADWIQGLPSSFNVDFENFAIIEIAKRWDSLPENPTDSQVEKILSNWFDFVSNHTIRLFDKNKIEYKLK